MNSILDYENQILQLVKNLKTANRPVILFGTEHFGILAKNVLSLFEVYITCFSDNSELKQGKMEEGIPVLSPSEIKEKYPDSAICICSFNKKNQKVIKEQLINMGFLDFIPLKLLIYAYYTRIADRKNVIDDLMNAYENLFEKDEKSKDLFINTMNLVITEKCSLRCKDCSHRIPYYDNPQNYSVDTIIKGIDKFANAVDAIGVMYILGGEPFMHPELDKIIEHIAGIPNILFSEIVTNGTIVPNDRIFQAIKKYGVSISISDYGKISAKKVELKKLCDENCAICALKPNNTWYYPGKMEPHHRSEDDNLLRFSKCHLPFLCSTLMKGEYHLCPFSAHGTAIGFVPKRAADYIDLFETSLTDQQLRESLHCYIHKTKCITACDYCGPKNVHEPHEVIPTAVQLDH